MPPENGEAVDVDLQGNEKSDIVISRKSVKSKAKARARELTGVTLGDVASGSRAIRKRRASRKKASPEPEPEEKAETSAGPSESQEQPVVDPNMDPNMDLDIPGT